MQMVCVWVCACMWLYAFQICWHQLDLYTAACLCVCMCRDVICSLCSAYVWVCSEYEVLVCGPPSSLHPWQPCRGLWQWCVSARRKLPATDCGTSLLLRLVRAFLNWICLYLSCVWIYGRCFKLSLRLSWLVLRSMVQQQAHNLFTRSSDWLKHLLCSIVFQVIILQWWTGCEVRSTSTTNLPFVMAVQPIYQFCPTKWFAYMYIVLLHLETPRVHLWPLFFCIFYTSPYHDHCPWVPSWKPQWRSADWHYTCGMCWWTHPPSMGQRQ